MRAPQVLPRVALAASLVAASWAVATGPASATPVRAGASTGCSVLATQGQSGTAAVKVSVKAVCGSQVQTVTHDLTVTRDGATVGTADKQCGRPSGSTSSLTCTVTVTVPDPTGDQTFVATDRMSIVLSSGSVQRVSKTLTFTS